MSEADAEAAKRRDSFQAGETGYSNVQGTKPDSLTIAQSDSPAGLAAWIAEKFRTWSDCGGDLDSVYSKDTLLTNMMFYWAPNSVAARRALLRARRDAAAFASRISRCRRCGGFPASLLRLPRSGRRRGTTNALDGMARGGISRAGAAECGGDVRSLSGVG